MNDEIRDVNIRRYELVGMQVRPAITAEMREGVVLCGYTAGGGDVVAAVTVVATVIVLRRR